MLIPGAMGDTREQSEAVGSEQKTQPFSQSDFQARIARARMEEHKAFASTVPLDNLVVPQDKDIRIIMRPLAKGRAVIPGNQENCEWLSLRDEVAADEEKSEHNVLAVTQTHRVISFPLRIPGQRQIDELWCELYFDPAGDDLKLWNRSEVPFTLYRISRQPPDNPREPYELKPNMIKSLAPGSWRIKVDDTDVLDFRILEKRPARLRGPSFSGSDSSSQSDLAITNGKRSCEVDEDDTLNRGKRRRPSDPEEKNNDGVIMFLPAKTNPLVFPPPSADAGKELSTTNGHALLDIQTNETVLIPKIHLPGGTEVEEYTISKRDHIAQSGLSTVFTAEHSNIPGGVIVVKILKTWSPAVPNNEAALAKNLIRQADIWRRELRYQESLDHRSIVRLYGGDARYLSLYMEHVDARDLTFKGTWRAAGTDMFCGDKSDAAQILRDIASALHYIHGKGLVHNDIKPGNILYSRERGAVLCDLGLSTKARDPVAAGTPWYVPPEFIGLKQRGVQSDVWALGVTMLYLLGKISWPDARASQRHPRHLHWIIAKLNSKDRAPQSEAVAKMRQWLNEVAIARNHLDTHDKLERLVHRMLFPNPKERVTLKEIVNHFFNEQPTDRR